LGVATSQLQAQSGKIGIGPQLQHNRSYGAIIGDQQLVLTSSSSAPLKNPSDYTLVGQSVPRLDLLDKAFATFTYVQDVVVDGMLHGRVVRPAGRNATFASIDAVSLAATQAIPGFIQVVQQGNFVGVVAQTEYAALVAARTLKVNWTPGAPLIPQSALPQALTDPANIYQSGTEVDQGDVDGALAAAAKAAQATYFTPFQMHAAAGPSCAVADVRSDQATIWAGTQGVYPLQAAIAELLGLAPDAVRLVYVEAAGCYGHNGADDVAGDAALLSKAVGAPVRVMRTRQEEHGWEPLGPAMSHALRGGIDADGNLAAWEHTLYTPTHNSRPGGAGSLLAGQAIGLLPPALSASARNSGTRNGPVTYTFANTRMNELQVKSFNGSATGSGALAPSAPLTFTLLRSTALRSLGGFSNTFANESFLDELVALAGADPLEFRLRYSADDRMTAVLEALGQQAKWGSALPAAPAGYARGNGIAFLRYELKETYVASCAQVLVNLTSGSVTVERVVVAHDCGLIINPDGLRNQIEGNVMQGISRTLKEEVLFDANGVTSVVWAQNAFFPTPQYTPILFSEAPDSIDIVLIDHPTEVAWGAGEAVIGALPGAIGNAIFNATGARVRTLPMTPQRVLDALAAVS
jgi:CO/xanthine dehydrogenase Mo-binding subunit